MEYIFSEDKINKQINELENKDPSLQTKLDLRNLYKISNSNKKINGIIGPQPNFETLYCILLDDLEYFIDITKYIQSVPHKHLNTISLSQDECLTLVHDFYKTRDKEIFNSFLECYKLRNTNLQFSHNNETSYTYHISNYHESYIDLNLNANINDPIDLAHEYAHAIFYHLYPHIIDDINYAICKEMDGVFYQMEFSKYLIENNIYPNEAIKSLMLYNKDMYYDATELHEFLDINKLIYWFAYIVGIELGYKDNKDEIIKKVLTEKTESNYDTIGNILEYIILNNYGEKFQKELSLKYNKIKTSSFSLNN